MSNVSMMQVEKVRGVVVGFEYCQILLFQMAILRFSGVESEQKRIVGVVGVGDRQAAQIEGGISGDRSQKSIQQVVTLVIELRVMNTEHLIEFGATRFHSGEVEVIHNDRQGKIAKVVSFDFQFLQGLAETLDLRFLGVVHKNVRR